MHPVLATTAVVFFTSILTVLGQQTTEGHQIGDTSSGFDFILPVSIAQCDPILIYYNTTNKNAFHTDTGNLVWLFFYTPWDGDFFFQIPVSYGGIGYIDWICNVPAGNDFIIKLSSGGGPGQYYTVQPGSSSCLGDVTTTYPSAFYESTFQSYTHNPYPLASFYAANTLYHLPTVTFPTSSYPTITVNPNLAVLPTTSKSSAVISSSALTSTASPSTASPSAASPPAASPPAASSTTSSSHRTNAAAIAGGIVGGVALLALLTLALVVFLRRRRRIQFEDEILPPPVVPFLEQKKPLLYSGSSQNVHHSGQSMSEVGTLASQWSKSSRPGLAPYSETAGRTSTSALSENMNTASDLDSLTQDSTRLPTSKQRTHLPSLNSSADLASESSPPPQSQQSQPLTNDTQNGLTTVLDVVSRARLSPRERHALAANLLIADQLGQADLTRENTPPPYSG